MTDRLPTDTLAALIAKALPGFLDPVAPDLPMIETATAAGDIISLTVSYYPPLDGGADRLIEHRELRLSPVLLPDEDPADEPAEAVA